MSGAAPEQGRIQVGAMGPVAQGGKFLFRTLLTDVNQ